MSEQSYARTRQEEGTEKEQEPGYFEKTEHLLQQYVNNRITLLKLKGAEKGSRLMSLAVMFVLVLLLVFFVLVFISIMGGYYFAELTGSLFKGFGIITGIYLVLLILVLVFRKRYLEPFVANKVISIFFEKTAADEEPEIGQQD
ncbi:phage holin family protein [Flavihumibacter stibioxidans]|nr:phage holin family protein [Flavihumibacter stibioxidans]